MKYKVGDQVKCLLKDNNSDAIPYGMPGIIKAVFDNMYRVLFESKVSDRHTRTCLESDIILLKEENKMTDTEKKDGRGLYEVIVVNPNEDGDIILEEMVVAKDEGEAKFSSNIKEALKETKLKIRSVDVIVNYLGNVRPYETVQKVKLVGKVDGYSLLKEEK